MNEQRPTVPLLSMRGIEKSFPGTRALRGIDLDLLGGEIHALVGQNGSGKSTLIKILSGFHTPDAGSLALTGEPMSLPLSRRALHDAGIRFVHQDPGLSPKLTVLETIRLQAFETTWYGRIRWARERLIVRRLLADLGVALDPDRLIGSLAPSQRALVAIIRALQGLEDRPAVLVLDEPTASLSAADAERLFDTLRRLRGRGHAILFVSHRLDEVLSIADRISVIRDGQLVRSEPAGVLSEDGLITAILGRELGVLYPDRRVAQGDEVLVVRDLHGPTVDGFSCAIRRGEIVGVTGLGGMGHDEVPYLVFGALRPLGGSIEVDGKPLVPTPRRAIEAGLSFLPADRARTAGVGRATVAENVTLGWLAEYFTRGWLDSSRERSDVGRLLGAFEVRPPDPDRLLATFSGGNQQKALLAKWLHGSPAVLLLHEPTQGVDVGSRQQVFRLIRAAADAGAAVLIASSEYADLAHLCERVIVLRRGAIAAELHGAALTETAVLGACYATA